MDFWQKVEHFKKDMKARRGWWGLSNAVPPYLRLAWTLGIKTRPPYFMGFWRNTIGTGVGFAVVWGLLVWFWRGDGMSPWVAALTSAAMGFAFGLGMAWFSRHEARVLGLPSWDEYPGTGASVDTQDS